MKKENQLLARLSKMLGTTPKDETKAEEVQQTVVVDTSTFQLELDSIRADFEAFKADANALLAQADAEKQDLQTKLQAAETSLAQAEEMIAAAEVAKEAAELFAHETKMAARKTLVVAAIGDAKADAFLAATEMLDDTAFAAVSSALAGSVAAEADTALFKEVGVDAEADATTFTEDESEEMKILKAKYKAAQPAN